MCKAAAEVSAAAFFALLVMKMVVYTHWCGSTQELPPGGKLAKIFDF